MFHLGFIWKKLLLIFSLVIYNKFGHKYHWYQSVSHNLLFWFDFSYWDIFISLRFKFSMSILKIWIFAFEKKSCTKNSEIMKQKLLNYKSRIFFFIAIFYHLFIFFSIYRKNIIYILHFFPETKSSIWKYFKYFVDFSRHYSF